MVVLDTSKHGRIPSDELLEKLRNMDQKISDKKQEDYYTKSCPKTCEPKDPERIEANLNEMSRKVITRVNPELSTYSGQVIKAPRKDSDED